MEKPLLVLKPGIINGLFPLFMKNAFYSILVALIVYLVANATTSYSSLTIISWLAIAVLVFAVLPLVWELLYLKNTSYKFFRDHIVRQTKLIHVKRYSVRYGHITNIKTIISLWDRLSNGGDIVLHTPENVHGDLVLHYINNPIRIEKAIHKLVDKHRKH